MRVKTLETTSAEQPASEAASEVGAGLQPFLHDACVTLYAPSFTVSRMDGQLSGGADGFYHGERRALSRLEVSAAGVPLAPVSGSLDGADRAVFQAALRGVAESTADPAVMLLRRRETAPGRLTETLEVVNSGRMAARLRLTVAVGTDLASMEQVKSGARVELVRAEAGVSVGGAAGVAEERDVPADAGAGTDTAAGTGVGAETGADTGAAGAAADGLRWTDGTLTVRLASAPRPTVLDSERGLLHYDVRLAPGERWRSELVCTAEDTGNGLGSALFPAPDKARDAPWSTPRLRSPDRTLDRWLTRSIADVRRLLLADPQQPDDVFLAAGAPWFATLFGRDALWAARMLLPLGTALPAATLRVLARRQGTRVDTDSLEQPGKILHEVRRTDPRIAGNPGTGTGAGAGSEPGAVASPAIYYGTIDATPLWLILLHDAWRWGLDPARTAALLPAAEAALTWLAEYGDADGDGFLEYVDLTGRGLANQGWRDSGDAIRHRDGSFATAPIAMCEVQGYAYEAARGGAALLRAFDRPGADRWEEWAERLQARFRAHFWVEDDRGPYPATALDRDKKPVASVTSSFGHLLGTGLLNAEESALLADRLAATDLDSGFGLRTMSRDFPRFNPLGYHIGAVWPHDTAIAVHGLARAGLAEPAARLAAGLLRAAEAFDGRLPELYGGYGADTVPRPVPYPAACRPQAWAAASAMLVVQSLLGLTADVPGGTLTVAARLAEEYRPLRVTGLELAGEPLEITVHGDGTPEVRTAPGISVVSGR